ncbi:MAG: DNA/RNA non-specific endonuclease, partial [Candidatus Cryptobacteroides sp.]|nr:DNA/RNA non-specific endonuclease [Candidatus Cryptobacteroides sp.]
MKKSRLLVVLALLPLLCACDPLEKNGGNANTSVSVSFKSASGDCKAGSVFVVANSIAEWTLELDFGENEPWATLSHTSGKGYKSNILLSYEQNDGSESRAVRIIMSSAGKTSEAVFTQNSQQQESHDYGVDVTGCGWLELPETKAGDGMEWFCHHFNHNGVTKRNYSFYYSYSDYVSLWVAYPLNSSLIGSGSRTDEWAYDPLIPANLQMNVVETISGYNRGHQLPSADRYSGDSNPQTFYSTNMTPQRGKFNQNIWAGVEDKVRSWAKDGKADTLY